MPCKHMANYPPTPHTLLNPFTESKAIHYSCGSLTKHPQYQWLLSSPGGRGGTGGFKPSLGLTELTEYISHMFIQVCLCVHLFIRQSVYQYNLMPVLRPHTNQPNESRAGKGRSRAWWDPCPQFVCVWWQGWAGRGKSVWSFALPLNFTPMRHISKLKIKKKKKRNLTSKITRNTDAGDE